jgi:hypothetical protein
MADTDNSSYILRYNLITLNPEFFVGSDWYPVTVSAGDITGGTITGTLAINSPANTDALTINSTTLSRGLVVNGKGLFVRNNGSSLSVKGLQDPSEGSAQVNSYSGIFYDSGYNVAGTLKTRFITGGNLEMDVELQSPHMLRLTAGDNTTTDASIRMSSNTNVMIQTRAENERVSTKYLVIDRVDTTVHKYLNTSVENTSDVTLGVNSGTLQLPSPVQFSKAPIQNVSALATSGTITPDGTLGPTFTIALAGAVTLNGPSNPVNGQKVTFIFINGASSNIVTLATGSGNFRFGTDIPSYTGTPSKTDYVGAIYNSAATRWDVVSVIQGF